MKKEVINVGVIGCGTVGSGVVKLLTNNQEHISRKSGIEVVLKKVAERDKKRWKQFKLPEKMFTDNADDLLNDPQIDVVVEVIGGVNPAKKFIETALHNKKHVVTANKELIAKHGRSLFTMAKINNVTLHCEASAGGGIPIIHALTQSLAANKFKKLYGIVNGTTNYILTKMYRENAEFSAVLKEAQELGYAEADPTADVDGHDAAYKLSILGMLAFNSYFDYRDIYTEGIRNISRRDIEIAKEYGYVIKLLATGIEHDNKNVELRVHPVMIRNEHPLAAVNDSFNAVFVQGDHLGDSMFYGRGAGELPTASAIVGDVIDLAMHQPTGGTSPAMNFDLSEKKIIPMGNIISKYFLRLKVKDQPGVLAAISKIFADQEVSIKAVQQKEAIGVEAELVIITHSVKESSMQRAVRDIQKLSTVLSVCSLIRADL